MRPLRTSSTIWCRRYGVFLSELERLRHTVAEFGRRHRLPARLLFEMNLALEEILANIISYGFKDEQDADIWVGLYLAQGETNRHVVYSTRLPIGFTML